MHEARNGRRFLEAGWVGNAAPMTYVKSFWSRRVAFKGNGRA
jgi:hypothetical protein